MLAAVVSSVLIGSALAYDPRTCRSTFSSYDLSSNFNETIGHAIHSLNTIGLRLFNPLATEETNIPTVNHDLRDKENIVLELSCIFKKFLDNFLTILVCFVFFHQRHNYAK